MQVVILLFIQFWVTLSNGFIVEKPDNLKQYQRRELRQTCARSHHGVRGRGGKSILFSQNTGSIINVQSERSVEKLSRPVQKVQKFARLPVWPALNGIILFVVGKLFGDNVGARLENEITGRVCPNFFDIEETSPFVMLVHHCHSFSALDPFRVLFRNLILPEGFPAHAHAGFTTLTYFLDGGGFVHRDSLGVKQTYGAATKHGDAKTTGNPYHGKHTQWLFTGSGMMHEEMFDISTESLPWWKSSRQELYQIWLNVPAAEKGGAPFSLLLGGDGETPNVKMVEEDSQRTESTTLVLAGSYQGKAGAAPCLSKMDIFHVAIAPGGSWSYPMNGEELTAIAYIRKGSVVSGDSTNVPAHYTAYFQQTGSSGDEIKLSADEKEGTDFLFLAGKPLNEPCIASGPFVLSSQDELNRALIDYRSGAFGLPWDHKISDDEWKASLR